MCSETTTIEIFKKLANATKSSSFFEPAYEAAPVTRTMPVRKRFFCHFTRAECFPDFLNIPSSRILVKGEEACQLAPQTSQVEQAQNKSCLMAGKN